LVKKKLTEVITLNEVRNFICTGDKFDEIPTVVLGTAEVTLPKAHCDKVQMSKLSKEIKNNNKDVFCKVPFCSTVEAEAFGGDIKLGDEKNGPRVNKYILSSTLKDFLFQLQKLPH